MERSMGKGRGWRGEEGTKSNGNDVGQKGREGQETVEEGKDGQVIERGREGGQRRCGVGWAMQPRDRSSNSSNVASSKHSHSSIATVEPCSVWCKQRKAALAIAITIAAAAGNLLTISKALAQYYLGERHG